MAFIDDDEHTPLASMPTLGFGLDVMRPLPDVASHNSQLDLEEALRPSPRDIALAFAGDDERTPLADMPTLGFGVDLTQPLLDVSSDNSQPDLEEGRCPSPRDAGFGSIVKCLTSCFSKFRRLKFFRSKRTTHSLAAHVLVDMFPAICPRPARDVAAPGIEPAIRYRIAEFARGNTASDVLACVGLTICREHSDAMSCNYDTVGVDDSRQVAKLIRDFEGPRQTPAPALPVSCATHVCNFAGSVVRGTVVCVVVPNFVCGKIWCVFLLYVLSCFGIACKFLK